MASETITSITEPPNRSALLRDVRQKAAFLWFYVGEYQAQRADDQPFLLQMKLLSSLCLAQSLQSYLLSLDGGRRGISSSTLTPEKRQKPAQRPSEASAEVYFHN